jgi:hypothetical protein
MGRYASHTHHLLSAGYPAPTHHLLLQTGQPAFELFVNQKFLMAEEFQFVGGRESLEILPLIQAFRYVFASWGSLYFG